MRNNEIGNKFVKEIANRHFLRKEYAVYLYTLKPDNNPKFELNLEAFAVTQDFDKTHGFPFPIDIGNTRKVSFSKFQVYAYGKGGYSHECGTIYQEEENLRNSIENPNYWEKTFVYYSGYQFERLPMVIFLVFDINTVERLEKEIMQIDLNPLLKIVEDIYHKKLIFPDEYLELLENNISSDIFSTARHSISNLHRGLTSSHYLLKVYYDFIFHNLQMFDKKKIKPELQEKLLVLTREFEKNQENLFRIPNYREHFLHQCNVYLLGLAILSKMYQNKFVQKLEDFFNKSYRLKKEQEYVDPEDISIVWFITSMFHDIAYPVEKSEQWLDSLFKEYIYPKKHNKSILKIDLKVSKVIADRDYSQCIEDLAEYQSQMLLGTGGIKIGNFKKIKKACPIRNQIIDQTIDFHDHGILAAIMLLNRFNNDEEIYKYLFPAAAAIAIHKFRWIDRDAFNVPCHACKGKGHDCEKCKLWKESYDTYFKNDKKLFRYVDFQNDPIGFLLIFCDTIQDWGRYNFEYLSNAYEKSYKQSCLSNIQIKDNTIIFDYKLKSIPEIFSSDKQKLEDEILQEKKQGIPRFFSRLKFIEGHDIVANLYPAGKDEPIVFSMNSFQ